MDGILPHHEHPDESANGGAASSEDFNSGSEIIPEAEPPSAAKLFEGPAHPDEGTGGGSTSPEDDVIPSHDLRQDEAPPFTCPSSPSQSEASLSELIPFTPPMMINQQFRDFMLWIDLRPSSR